jgi:hypothetical protein
VTHPDPEPTSLLGDRIGAYGKLRWNSVLTGHGDAQSVAVIGESVVATDEYVIDHGTEGQRIAPMRTLVSEGHDTTAGVAIDRDGLAENRSRDRALREFRRESGDVPVLTKKHVPPQFVSRSVTNE